MKQKNLIMLGVAMACGLIAAIAVAQLSAGSGKGPETGKALVAKKDIPLNTKLDEKELDNWIAWAEMPKTMIPPDAVVDIEALKNKEVNRTLKAGNVVTVTDLGVSAGIALPDGCKQITIKSSQVDAVAGFARPGSKVDVMYVERLPSGKSRSAVILRDMLILAVNTVDQLKEGTGRAITQVESVSLAVTDKQANLLALAEERGRLKMVLRGSGQIEKTKDGSEKIEWLDDPFAGDVGLSPVPTVAIEKGESIVFARKAVPVNTLINADNIGEYFGTLEVKVVPEGAYKSAEDLKGLYVVRALEPGQNLLKAAISKEPAEIIETPGAPPVVKVPEKIKLPRFDQVIQAGGQSKRVVWLETAPGKWRRFESDKDADDYTPETPAKPEANSTEENKPAGDAKPVGS
ncbi:Flp pilus assembly protein CpaB [Zavarzinella formosa]|uniref:Flp pilus assembly protein CpaB n=1 Tax=Zavarzinella formosa TaxID=360055 RepID=UPI0002D803A2|nr:Flp pilus assembly protein CpaB [Zavarzinella formosa]